MTEPGCTTGDLYTRFNRNRPRGITRRVREKSTGKQNIGRNVQIYPSRAQADQIARPKAQRADTSVRKDGPRNRIRMRCLQRRVIAARYHRDRLVETASRIKASTILWRSEAWHEPLHSLLPLVASFLGLRSINGGSRSGAVTRSLNHCWW